MNDLSNEEKNLLEKLSKPIVNSDKLEQKLVKDWNKKSGTNYKSISEIHEASGWNKRFDDPEWESYGFKIINTEEC